MSSLELLLGYMICVVIGLFALAVLWRIATGQINLNLLISEKTGEASMSRFQLLIFTCVIGLSFFLIVVSNSRIFESAPAASHTSGPSLPDLPGGVLGLLGISASSYTVSKAIQANMPSKPGAGTPGGDQPGK